MAAPQVETRLVSCGEASCLLVSGRRTDPASRVRINGHYVSVEGRKAWRVRLPIETVREWSLPMARAIDITVDEPEVKSARADLPIGLLGHSTDLASLVIGSP